MSSEFIINVIKNIEGNINRNLTDCEETVVIKDIGNALSTPSDFNNVLQKYIRTGNIHEVSMFIIKKNLFINRNEIHTIINELAQPSEAIKKYTSYIMLDSKYRVLENDGTTYFKWIFANNMFRRQGTCNSIADIKNIKSIKIMPFRMPNTTNANNDYKRISIFIKEFSAQSFIAHENKQFHFMMRIDDLYSNKNWLEITSEGYHDGEYRFNKLITTLDTITICFGSPLDDIKFNKDRAYATVLCGDTTKLIFEAPHNCNTGDYVCVSDLSSSQSNNNHTLDISNVKSKKISDTVLEIPIDTNYLLLNITNPDYKAHIYFGNTRLFINLEINYYA